MSSTTENNISRLSDLIYILKNILNKNGDMVVLINHENVGYPVTIAVDVGGITKKVIISRPSGF